MYEKLAEMSRNNDCTAGNLLDYLHHQKYYKCIVGGDLARQTNTSIPQLINITEKLEENISATMFFIAEKQ